MDVIDYFLWSDNILWSEQSNEVFFLEIAIDIDRDVSALCWDEKLVSGVWFFFDQIVKHCIDDLFWFAVAIESAGIYDVDSSRLYGIGKCAKHFIIVLIGRLSIISAYP